MFDLFYPNTCAICGQIVPEGVVVCPDCLHRLRRTEQAFMRGNSTEDIFRGAPKFVRGGVFFFFEHGSAVHNAIHRMKYGRFANPQIAYALAKEAALDFMQSDFFDGIDAFMPVPLHPRRFRERGFNQSEWICKALSDMTGIPMDTTHLYRVRNNEHQARMTEQERQHNVTGIFELRYPEDLYRKHIMLVDDIITTGATLRSCMEALRPARGHRVSVFGLGKAN